MSTMIRTRRRRSGARYAVQHRDWQIHLAALGSAFAIPVPHLSAIEITVREGAPGGPETASADAAWTRLCLGAFGSVTAHPHQAPPALLVDVAGNVVQVNSYASSKSVQANDGEIIFACSPSVIQALGPGELFALPHLLRGSPDLSALLDRWVDTADQAGATGVAAMIAQYRPKLLRAEIKIPGSPDEIPGSPDEVACDRSA